MKTNRFAMAVIFAIITSIFFACSDSSPNNSSDPSSSSNGITEGEQVYFVSKEIIEQCNEEASCFLNVPYTGSGVIKGTFLTADGEEVLGMMDMGTVNNGKINLEFHTPKEEFQEKNLRFRLYNNNVFIGNLLLMVANLSRDNDMVGLYFYFPEDYQYKDTWDLFPNQNVIFETDIDVKKGWNLFYYGNRYKDIDGEEVLTVIKSSDVSVLNGAELKWVLTPPEMH